MRKRVLIIVAAALVIAGCAEVMKVLESAVPAALTEQDVVAGLKEALITGAKNSAGRLSATDGYYSDLAVRILLPDEAKVIVDNISKIPGGDKLVEDVIVRINRAAEDAAKEVAPVFVTAVTEMTIADAWGILRGADNAATGYLHRTTYNQLYSLYKPKIETSTRKKIVAGISIKSPCDYKTQRGIQIGSHAPEVQAAYKNEINPQNSNPESTIVAGTVYGGIIFGLKDNIVTSIFIGAAAE